MSLRDGSSLMDLENSYLKVPYENLSKCFRLAQRVAEKELAQVLSSLNQLSQRTDLTREEALKSLENIVQKVETIKKKLEDIRKEEEVELQKCKARLDDLKVIDGKRVDEDKLKIWQTVKLDRLLVDYLLREGYFETAIALAEQTNIQNLVDISTFVAAKKVYQSLENKSCTDALMWCAENRTKLRRIKSDLEFNIRLQEFIEQVKENNILKAIAHARKNFPPFSSTNMEQVQEVMGLLAFKNTCCTKYMKYLDENRWEQLKEEFRRDNYRLHSLTPDPSLVLHLQAGLSTLKTSLCASEATQNMNCPVCNSDLKELSSSLPLSHHSQSSLVCFISGTIMDTDNYPCVLPNGHVYSKKAMMEQAKRYDGKVFCPRSGMTFSEHELKKAFIM